MQKIIKILKIIVIAIIIISILLSPFLFFMPAFVNAASTDVLVRQSLSVHVVSPYYIKLEWKDDNIYKKGFVVQKAVDSGSFKSIATVSANSTTYNDSDVAPGYVYTYRIFSIDRYNNSSQYTIEVSTSSDMISKPDSLDLITSSPTQIELNWTYPGYKQYDTIIERKSGKNGKWEIMERTPIGTYKYIDKELTAGVQYYYRIKAVTDSNIFSTYYPSEYGKTVYTSLPAPEDLYGYAISQSKIYLTWKYEKETDYFEVERKTKDNDYILIAINPYTNKWFQDSGLTTGEVYTYRIRAKKGNSLSEYSQEITINCGYLNPPTALSARALSSEAIELKWENRGLDIGAEVELWRRSETAEDWELYTVMDRNYNKFVDYNVEKDIKYSYRLRSVISYNKVYSNYSNIVEAKASEYNSPPQMHYTVIDKDRVQLFWKYEDNKNKINTNNEDSRSVDSSFKEGYVLEIKEGAYGKWEKLTELTLASENYFVTGLNEKNIYYFRIKAFSDYDAAQVYSQEIEVTTRIPAPPKNLSVETLSSSKIKLKWQNEVQNSSEVGYIIERKLNTQNYFKIIATLPYGSDSYYIDGDLSPSKRYNYRIKAFNKAGESEYTNEIFAVTDKAKYFYDIPSSHPHREAINDLAARGIIKGKAAQTQEGEFVEMFYPDEVISRAEFICILVRAFKMESKATGSFADVTYGNWFYKEIMTAKNMGIITGDKNNYFYPNNPITYEEMWGIINRMLKAKGKPLVNIGDDKEKDDGITIGEKELVTRKGAAIEIYKIID